MVLVSGFLSKLKKTPFLAKKNPVFHFRLGCYYIARLFYGPNLHDLSQTSGIWCEKWISDFLPQVDRLRLKYTKNGRKQPFSGFFPFLWAHMVGNVKNFVWREFWDIWKQKVLIKFSIFDFSIFCLIFQKKNSRRPKPTFLASDSWLDGFSIKF